MTRPAPTQEYLDELRAVCQREITIARRIGEEGELDPTGELAMQWTKTYGERHRLSHPTYLLRLLDEFDRLRTQLGQSV